FEVTMRMLRIFVEKVCGPARLFKPRVMITVPFGVTSVESRAVHEAALAAGSRAVHLIQEPLAGAMRGKPGLLISQRTAEEARVRIAAALPEEEERTLEVQGQDQVTGLPRPITLTTNEVVEALQETLTLQLVAVKNVLERTPPELASDIIDRGMVVCGGGS